MIRRLWMVLVAALVVGALPGVAQAHWGPPGANGAQLDVNPSDELGPVAVVEVKGQGFAANATAQIFECPTSHFYLPANCPVLGAVQTNESGGFTANVAVTRTFVHPNELQFFIPDVYDCANSEGCKVVASTDPASLRLTPVSQAEHYLCFSAPESACDGGSNVTTTTTTTLPPREPEWQPAPAMISARQRLGATSGLDGRIYAIGGNDTAGNALASAEVFDPCTNKWTPLPPMPTARTQLAAATGPDGRIYAIGGRDHLHDTGGGPGTPLATVEAYDPATNQWSVVSGLAVPRSDLGATRGSDGRILALGGTISTAGIEKATTGNLADQVATVESYDIATGRWLPVTPLPTPRAQPGAATGSDGRTYAVAGKNVAAHMVMPLVDAYTPGPAGAPGIWQPAATLFSLPQNPGVTAGPDGRIYAVGGTAPHFTGLRTTFIYDTATDTWTPSDEALDTPRHLHGMATGRDGRIYAIGGTSEPAGFATPARSLATVESRQVGPNTCPRLTQPADFDGDFDTDVSVFRPSTGTWFAKDGDTVAYGAEGDIPVPADYDGDQVSDVAIFRPSVGLWAIHRSSDDTDVFVTYGIGTDVPVPADYDGDGQADIAIFRPEFGLWWYRSSSTGLDVPTTFGIGTDTPVPADYDGDARADIAVFRNGTWFTLPSSGGAYVTSAYGNPGDIPVPADYDADRVVDRATFRPTDGTWSLHRSSDNTDEVFTFGLSGDVPVPGDYNGDRISDPAVFRPSTGQWFIETGETQAWGIATDIPLPLPAAIRLASFP